MSNTPKPTEINFHKASHVLEIAFNDGSCFNLPTEYLRVYSPSAEVQGHGPGQEKLQIGKQDVNIERIEQVGNYAIQLYFDDNHDTGIYSWGTLYNLGKNQEILWQEYLDKLKAAGHVRPEPQHLQ
ncbi:MAG: gamma-butyrobetaine hydroxylase-like domain-containing protein [Gammaproteobacteria bacterium]